MSTFAQYQGKSPPKDSRRFFVVVHLFVFLWGKDKERPSGFFREDTSGRDGQDRVETVGP